MLDFGARVRASLTIAGIAMAGLADTAAAADLGQPYVPAPAPAYRLPPSWTGLYLGGNIGYGNGFAHAAGDPIRFHDDGVVGGIHGGFNWQVRNFVLGAEADFDWSGMSGRKLVDGVALTTEHRHLASVRGRLGLAFDRTMVFGTLGYGWSDVRLTADAGFGSANETRTAGGLVWGGGIEHKISPRLSMRAEALRFETHAHWSATDGSRVNVDAPATVVRAGLTWHFDLY